MSEPTECPICGNENWDGVRCLNCGYETADALKDRGGGAMTVTDVTIPTIKAFCNLEPKAQALKPLEEAAETFAEWQKYNSCTDMCRVCEHTDENRAAFDGPANRYPASAANEDSKC